MQKTRERVPLDDSNYDIQESIWYKFKFDSIGDNCIDRELRQQRGIIYAQTTTAAQYGGCAGKSRKVERG
jgi:hypothetical protein